MYLSHPVRTTCA